MLPIDRSEILPLGEYEKIRDHFRSRVIEEKRGRRVHVGEHYTATFENRDTVMLQIQEMLRTERITQEKAILHEIETYNDLLPGDRQVSMTFFVEIADKPTRDRMLVELAGLEDSIHLEVEGVSYPFHGKREGAEPGRTTAVHYLKCDLPAEVLQRLRAGEARAALVVSHPRGAARTDLTPATLAKLADDLA
jgi:hypothetical protein